MRLRGMLVVAIAGAATSACDLSYLGPGCFGSCTDADADDVAPSDSTVDAPVDSANDSGAHDASSDTRDASSIDSAVVDSAKTDSGATDASSDAPADTSSTYTSVIADAGTLAWYRFEEISGVTVKDSSGNGYDGLFDTTGVTLGVAGISGNAVRFAGTSTGATIPDHTDDKLSFAGNAPFSFEAWLSPDAFGSGEVTIVHKEVLVGSAWQGWNIGVGAGGVHGQRQGGSGGGTIDDLFAATTIPKSTWTYVVETYDGATMRIYVNGVKLNEVASAIPMIVTAQSLVIGSDRPASEGYEFPGAMDEVAIYTRALTDLEVQTHFLAR